MKIVIDIPEKYLNSSSGIIDVTLFTGENNAITDINVEDNYAKFQVLPKGHGNLVDADKVILGLVYGTHIDKAKCGEITKIFDNAVVIPADKGE